MDSNWFKVLVIILSAMLALFLLLSIVVLVKVVQIVKQIKRIIDHAENTLDKAEHVADFFKKTATPVAIVKLFSNISEAVSSAGKKSRKK